MAGKINNKKNGLGVFTVRHMPVATVSKEFSAYTTMTYITSQRKYLQFLCLLTFNLGKEKKGKKKKKQSCPATGLNRPMGIR
jgi:hypothetical protein